MPPKSKTEKALRELADAAILVFFSRFGVPVILCLTGFIASTIYSMDKNVTTALTKIEGQDTRIRNLEDWRNTSGARLDSLGKLNVTADGKI